MNYSRNAAGDPTTRSELQERSFSRINLGGEESEKDLQELEKSKILNFQIFTRFRVLTVELRCEAEDEYEGQMIKYDENHTFCTIFRFRFLREFFRVFQNPGGHKLATNNR